MCICIYNSYRYHNIAGCPKLTAEDDLDNLISLSHIFRLPEIETICDNIKNGEECLNISIGMLSCDRLGLKMKELFLNNTRLADVIFNVEGMQIILLNIGKAVIWNMSINQQLQK